jgi:hypothetical protein
MKFNRKVIWETTIPRTTQPKQWPKALPIARAIKELAEECRPFRSVAIYADMEYDPVSSKVNYIGRDQAVSLEYLNAEGKTVIWYSDKYKTIAANIQAITYTLRKMRQIADLGCTRKSY